MLVKCWNISITIKYNLLQVLTPSQVKLLSEIFSWLNSLTQTSKVSNHKRTTEMHQSKKMFSAVPHYFSWNINLILKVDQLNVEISVQGVRHQICIALLILRHNHLVISKFQLRGTPLSLSFTSPHHCPVSRQTISVMVQNILTVFPLLWWRGFQGTFKPHTLKQKLFFNSEKYSSL